MGNLSWKTNLLLSSFSRRKMKHIAEQKAPWAVKSGGHASNPGFSSTTGVHISLKLLDRTILSADKSTVEIGFGRVRISFTGVHMRDWKQNKC